MTPDRPNVLFLVADSLRYDAVFGDWCATPTLDSLAEDGVAFSRCYSQGISTAPAMTAMLTGRYPLDYGGHWYITDDQPTMAEQFQHNEYTTAAIHSNPNVSRLRNFDKGFDCFEENILPLSGGWVVERLPDRLVRLLNKGARVLSRTPYLPADRINEQMADWIAGASEPWFLWTQYMDTHGPYLPGNEFSYRNKFRAERLWRKAAVEAPEDVTRPEHEELRRNYRLEIEYLDSALGRYFDRLERRGHLENTVVVIVGDHGDEFAEHGLYGHKNLPHEELVRVPLLIRFPDGLSIQMSDEVETKVRCLDVLPTVLNAVGAELTQEMETRLVGESVLDAMSGGDTNYETIVTEKQMREGEALRFGFRTGRWTYMYDGRENEEYLYDRTDDTVEQDNVIDQFSSAREQFRGRLAERLDAIDETSEDVRIPAISDDPGVKDRLQALGYR